VVGGGGTGSRGCDVRCAICGPRNVRLGVCGVRLGVCACAVCAWECAVCAWECERVQATNQVPARSAHFVIARRGTDSW